MIEFTAVVKKFDAQGEKTGWTYIERPQHIAHQLNPDNKKAFRVKGFLDDYYYAGISLLPLGEGAFIMALNAVIRKAIGKEKGATVKVRMEVDSKPVEICPELLECLVDEPAALEYFNGLTKSHRNYFSKWIESARTEETKTKRIADTVTACLKRMDYGEMIRSLKHQRNYLSET
jgi:hypothetical protein